MLLTRLNSTISIIMDHNLEVNMMNRKLASRILLFSILIAGLLGIYSQVAAQGEVVGYLEERFKQVNLPVVETEVIQDFPLIVQVTLQSTSDGAKASPDDPINLNLVSRELILASRQGYLIERFSIVLLDSSGAQMAKTEHSAEITDLLFSSRSSNVPDSEATKMINENIDLYGMLLVNLDVVSSDGLQTVIINLSTPSLEVTNQALPQFMPSLRSLLEDINSQSGQIVICKLELRDQSGRLLLNYILDLQLRAENWWMADNLTRDWFPHP